MPEFRDIPYGDGLAGQMIDLYVPEGAGPWPLVVWSQGSGWSADDAGRSTAGIVAGHLGPRGFAVAGVSVRSSRQAVFPAQLDDVQAAVRHLHAHADEWALDASRFGISGDSSGGWTAAMGALTTSLVKAAVPFYPPTDLLRMDEQMLPGAIEEFALRPGEPYGHNHPASPESRLLGGNLQDVPELAKQASPVTHVHPAAPPFLILHGQGDRIVPYGQSELLYQALAEAGCDVELVSLPYAGHGPWNGFLTDAATKRDAFSTSSRNGQATAPRPADPTWDTIATFFRRHLALPG